jgi:hypothetical protein
LIKFPLGFGASVNKSLRGSVPFSPAPLRPLPFGPKIDDFSHETDPTKAPIDQKRAKHDENLKATRCDTADRTPQSASTKARDDWITPPTTQKPNKDTSKFRSESALRLRQDTVAFATYCLRAD